MPKQRSRKKHPWCMGCWQKFKFWQRGILHERYGWCHKRCVKVAVARDVRQ